MQLFGFANFFEKILLNRKILYQQAQYQLVSFEREVCSGRHIYVLVLWLVRKGAVILGIVISWHKRESLMER